MSGSFDFSTEEMTVTGIALVQGRFQGSARRLHDLLSGVLRSEGEEIAQIARDRIGELFKNPALMQASIQTGSAEDIGGSAALSEVVISASGLPYLRIHEYGGVIMTPDIFPKNAEVLHFFTNTRAAFTASRAFASADEVFTRHTAAHATVIPERSYLRYALAQRRETIRTAFTQATVDALKRP